MENCHLCHILLISKIIHPYLHIQIILSGSWMAPLYLLFNVTFPTESQLEFPNFVEIKFFEKPGNKQIFCKNLKNVMTFFMDRVNCINAAEPLSRDSILLTTKYSKVSGTNVINLEMMRR